MVGSAALRHLTRGGILIPHIVCASPIQLKREDQRPRVCASLSKLITTIQKGSELKNNMLDQRGQ